MTGEKVATSTRGVDPEPAVAMPAPARHCRLRTIHGAEHHSVRRRPASRQRVLAACRPHGGAGCARRRTRSATRGVASLRPPSRRDCATREPNLSPSSLRQPPHPQCPQLRSASTRRAENATYVLWGTCREKQKVTCKFKNFQAPRSSSGVCGALRRRASRLLLRADPSPLRRFRLREFERSSARDSMSRGRLKSPCCGVPERGGTASGTPRSTDAAERNVTGRAASAGTCGG